jgi:3-hydroxy-3-methylglutaryl CoA synthase
VIGITSFGVDVPAYRLSREEIGRAWRSRGQKGEKAVARFDEDTLTMAANAAIVSLKYSDQKSDALFFGSTTPPYREKQTAAIIAAVTDHAEQTRTADFAGSLRSGTIALRSAIDAIKGGTAKNITVVASDSRMAAAKSQFEQQFGDGAAALNIGDSGLLATVEGDYTIFSEFFDTWRTERTPFVQSWEERFVVSEGFMNIMTKTIAGLMKKYDFSPADFAKVVFYAPDRRAHADLAKKLGFDPAQVQDPLFDSIGNTGAAAAPMMLVGALCDARPGDKILFANYGDGGDAFVLKATDKIAQAQQQKDEVKRRFSKKIFIDYERYLVWRGLVPFEQPRRPDLRPPAVPRLWRERKSVLALYGAKCLKCGAVQYPSQRVCPTCLAKDSFEDYKFSDKKGQIFTYAVDALTSNVEQPAIIGVVDFEGGGRIACEVTECEPSEIKIGMPVEMSLRKVGKADSSINNYFWKAKPIM